MLKNFFTKLNLILFFFICFLSASLLARTPNSHWPRACQVNQDLVTFNSTLERNLVYNTDKDLSRWFRVENPRARALVVHGLNLKPSKMTSLIKVLNESNIEVLLVSLTGHRGSLEEQKRLHWEDWLNDIHFHACLLKEENKKKKLPLFSLTFSVGSLTMLGHILEQRENLFSKSLMIAPAAWVKWYSEIPQHLAIFGRAIGLPSQNLPEYRSQNTTALSAYEAMATGRKSIELYDSSTNLLKKDFLVVLDPDDELVSLKNTEEFIKSHQLPWKVELVSNAEHRLDKGYHHLIIDEPSLGKKQWNHLKGLVNTFFRP